jgi:hypothetical protein
MNNHDQYNINKFNYKCLRLIIKGGGLTKFDPQTVSTEDITKRDTKIEHKHITFRDIAKVIKSDPILIGDLPKYMIKFMRISFPPISKAYLNKMMVNMEGLYSMTRYQGVKRIEEICEEQLNVPNIFNLKFVVGTSGIGGEVMNLTTRAKYIWGYEYSPVQYGILVNNVDVFLRYHKGDPSSDLVIERKHYHNHNIDLYNDDFTLNIDRNDADVMIVDPPWGGLSYKNAVNLVLELGGIGMIEIAERSKARLCLLKLPFNHDLKMFMDCDKFYTTFYKLKRYLIVALKKK